ncbi:Hypothetical_protein [Hexamita inflata]|uniref:Hypothetical_protein n=1 Tax=Hexamita inflata TaxID=28002 RepID=A0AA86TW63_9EUKA|nr:Hypothetical protein HINF_LOCUS18960 [Hexamita inflata]
MINLYQFNQQHVAVCRCLASDLFLAPRRAISTLCAATTLSLSQLRNLLIQSVDNSSKYKIQYHSWDFLPFSDFSFFSDLGTPPSLMTMSLKMSLSSLSLRMAVKMLFGTRRWQLCCPCGSRLL